MRVCIRCFYTRMHTPFLCKNKVGGTVSLNYLILHSSFFTLHLTPVN